MRRFHLIDGSLLDRNQATVDRMAADLVRLEAIGTESDAIRALMGRFTHGEIVMMVDDALFKARQSIVRREMTRGGR